MHWELPFLREVCRNANEIAVMAYNTGLTSPRAFETLIAAWTKDLAAALPSPQAGGCEWLMGVPAYDDDKDYHRPDVETVERGLNVGLGVEIEIGEGVAVAGEEGLDPEGAA